ncbi:MAG: division/cell wall cluster transcriptional repressor MraZ [Desulfuromonadaceae bacterium GWC2_58_13]|nr:MAG: division/cell wall cluster transcriptional repressor MraZ [Desulfuromonadaceae bacterium GWC2_58_13]
MIFQGEFNNSIDPKGRASIPAKFRDVLSGSGPGDCLVVTKNYEGGLSAYPPSVWKNIHERVTQLPAGPEKNAAFRLVLGPSVECFFDKQGRILIPPSLRTYAGLEKEIVLVGMAEKIDIYSQSAHAEVTRKSEELLSANPEFVASMGF